MTSLVETYLGRRKKMVVLVDPYSTGCLVGQEIAKRGYLLICLWSPGICDVMKQHTPISCRDLKYYSTITVDDLLPAVGNEHRVGAGFRQETLAATAAALKASAGAFPIVAIMAGGDRGVDFADAMSEQFGLLTNGTEIPNRRDKQIQQELVRATGMRAVRQAGGPHFRDVQDFLQTEPYPVVVKPIESSGSDAVKLCNTYQEAKAHFEFIMGTPMVDGGANTGVLCQEFLRGKEYIVDHVSRDGIHKTMMVWVYDKRPANGAPFVYYGCIPIDSESPQAKILIPYVRGVLDAMKVYHGASHAEVMLTADGPCLVEMNCRANGGDGIWRPLVRALTGGYTQVEVSADAYLDQERFMTQYPDRYPSPFKAAGCEIELVSYQRGRVLSTPGYTMIAQLPSFVHLESTIQAGSQVEYTIDLDTCVGTVCLMHPDPAVVEKDIQFIRYMEEINGIFQFEPVLENLKRPRGDAVVQHTVATAKKAHRRVFSSAGQKGLIRHFSVSRRGLQGAWNGATSPIGSEEGEQEVKPVVVVVDPYSTGTVIAKKLTKRGFHVLAVWTKNFPQDRKAHVPFNCGNIQYLYEVWEEDTLEETVERIQEATGTLAVVACMAGDGLGVDLADAISEHMNLLTNSTSVRRSDKMLQQELVAAAGLRATRQMCGSDFADVALFFKTQSYPIVMKPNRTAGSDGVKLCHNFDDAKGYFEVLKNSQVLDALEVPTIIAQEYLRGREFIVDHVSRDGVHKTLMVWAMDKRPANGVNNVYFGCVPVLSDSPDAMILIPYVRAALDALGVRNGPSHTEVVMTDSGPCLIKVDCTAHEGDGNWVTLCHSLTGGFNQVEATIDAYVDETEFNKIPDVPPSPFKAAGQEVLLVSYSRGTVKDTPGFDIIKQMPSFVYLETGITEGSFVDYTVDLFSSVGSVFLMHYDKETLDRDVERIREMEETNQLFDYDPLAGVVKLSDDTPYGKAATTIVADRPELFAGLATGSTEW